MSHKLAWIILKMFIAGVSVPMLAVILPLAADNPASKNNALIWLGGAIIAVNIVLVLMQNQKELNDLK